MLELTKVKLFGFQMLLFIMNYYVLYFSFFQTIYYWSTIFKLK